MLAALLHNPARFFKVAVTESLLALPSVIAGVMDRGELFMNGFIQFYSSCLNVFLQKVVDRDDLVFL
jgi:hypothetical protein